MYHAAVRDEGTRGIDDAEIVHYESPGVRYYNRFYKIASFNPPLTNIYRGIFILQPKRTK